MANVLMAFVLRPAEGVGGRLVINGETVTPDA